MDFERFGKTETIDLKENGRNVPVTDENKLEYVHLICQEKMVGSVKNQVRQEHPLCRSLGYFIAASVFGRILRYHPAQIDIDLRRARIGTADFRPTHNRHRRFEGQHGVPKVQRELASNSGLNNSTIWVPKLCFSGSGAH